MKRRIFFLFSSAVLILLFGYGCHENGIVSPIQDNSNSNLETTLLKVVDSDESLQSFEPNYNEEQAMSFLGTSLGKEFYPLKVGQRMKLVDRSLELPTDTSITEFEGTLYQKFEGTLFIVGYINQPPDSVKTRPDTTIQKSFTTEIYRKVKLVKIDVTGDPQTDWKITAVSLPQGGTLNPTAKIVKITLTPEEGDPLVIDDPNSYFFDKGNLPPRDSVNRTDTGQGQNGRPNVPMNGGRPEGMGPGNNAGRGNGNNNGNGQGNNGLGERIHNFLAFRQGQKITINVEVQSPNDSDFVTLTYGAMFSGGSRVKAKFDLVSSSGDLKVYEKTWVAHPGLGNRHIVINVLTNSSVFDDAAPVEENTWGIPYLVK